MNPIPYSIIKSLDDLDLMSPTQIDLTRTIDAKGSAAVENLLSNCMKAATEANMVLMSGIPLEAWQRASYEAKQRSKMPGTDIMKGATAEVIWIVTKMLQESYLNADKAGRDPALKERAEQLFGKGVMPDFERED